MSEQHLLMTFSMLSDRVRDLQAEQRHSHSAIQDTKRTVNILAEAHRFNSEKSAEKISRIDKRSAKMELQLEAIITWSKRVLLSLGLLLLSSGHLTIEHLAAIVRRVAGL